MKKSLVVLVALAFIATTIASAFAGPFSDVPKKHWAYEAVNSLASKGLIEGYADGKFKGTKAMTRYEMALVVARLIDKKFGGADLETLQKLTIEFADELALLGVKVQALEEEVKVMRGDMDIAKSDIDMLKKGGLGKIRLTIEDRIRFNEVKYKPATAGVRNTSRFDNRLRLNIKGMVDDNVSTFLSIQHNTVHGAGVQNNASNGNNNISPADTNTDLFLGYVDIKNFGGGSLIDNFRIGRQTLTIGKGFTFDNEIDGLLIKKNYRSTNFSLGAFDTRNAFSFPATSSNANDGLDSKLFTVDHAWKDIAAGLYYMSRSNTYPAAGLFPISTANMVGLTIDGKLGKNVVAFIEFASQTAAKDKEQHVIMADGTVATQSFKGNGFKFGGEWTINNRWDLTALYQDREKDFMVLGINDDYSDSVYYGNGPYDNCGAINRTWARDGAGTVLDYYNNSKIASVIIGYKATQKLHLDLWMEDFKGKKSLAATGATGNLDQTATQLVGTYQYRENTAFKLRYRTIKYKTGDVDYTAAAATQPADRDEVRLDLNVKF